MNLIHLPAQIFEFAFSHASNEVFKNEGELTKELIILKTSCQEKESKMVVSILRTGYFETIGTSGAGNPIRIGSFGASITAKLGSSKFSQILSSIAQSNFVPLCDLQRRISRSQNPSLFDFESSSARILQMEGPRKHEESKKLEALVARFPLL